MNILAVIPARYASTRFPGKPLVMIGDRPMIRRVHDVAVASGVFAKVVVATDDDRVAACVRDFGGVVEMTGDQHVTGTDRVAEVAGRYPDMDVVANVQGDQPFATAAMFAALVRPYIEGRAPAMTTVAAPLDMARGHGDPHTVKVILDQRGHALYFSRAPIPYFRHPGQAPVYHHLGLYAFRRDFLALYHTLAPTPLEQLEGLEQLRVLEHGHAIAVGLCEEAVIEINTPEDLALALSRMGQPS